MLFQVLIQPSPLDQALVADPQHHIGKVLIRQLTQLVDPHAGIRCCFLQRQVGFLPDGDLPASAAAPILDMIVLMTLHVFHHHSAPLSYMDMPARSFSPGGLFVIRMAVLALPWSDRTGMPVVP